MRGMMTAAAVLWLAASAFGANELLIELRKAEAAVYETGLSREERAQRLEALETEFKALLEKHEAPEDKALIYAELAYTWAQTGMLRPEKTIEYSKKALWGQLTDPLARMRLYVYWGDAIQLSRGPVRGKELAEVRKEAVIPYLTGLKEMLKQDLPEAKPEIPIMTILNDDGPRDSPEHARVEAQNKAAMLARWQCDMIDRRETLIGQIVYMYSRSPFATEELQALATDVVGNAKMVDKIVSRVKAKIEERKAAEASPTPAK